MTRQKANYRVLNKRLLPLFIAAFLHGFVLWYPLEKLFMHSIGFNDTGIGVMIVCYSIVMLLLETPSGILADRWSRKGVLIVASVLIAISSLLGGLSTEPILYIVSAMMWGAYYAFYSGTYDSIIYDTVYEETGNSDAYERYSGRMNVANSSALMTAAVIGGIISQMSNIPTVYFWTIPGSLAAIIALLWFKEPQLHKAAETIPVGQQVKETFKAVTTKGAMFRIILVAATVTIVLNMLYEFSQLWFIAVGTPKVLFGVAAAVVLSAFGVGGLLAARIGKRRRRAMVIALLGMIIASIGLVIPSPLIVIVIAQLTLGVSATVLNIIVMRDLHDLLPANLRAGSTSAVHTFSRVALLPLVILFGFISTHTNVFMAGIILLCLTLLAGSGELKMWLGKSKTA